MGQPEIKARWLLILLALGVITCQQPTAPQEDPDGGQVSIRLHGRVVDFETCSGGNGCRPVEGVRARLRTLPSYVSEPTTSPGRYTLPVPSTHEDDILVDPEHFPYAPTLNPWAAPAAVSDVYGIELFVLPIGISADGSDTLLHALANLDPPIQLVDDGTTSGEGGYIGQVLRRDDEGQHAVLGASVEVILPDEWPAGVPAPQVRYVASVPRYEEGDLLFAPEYPGTGPFGLFVVPTGHQTGMLTIHVETADTVFTEVVAPVAPGMVTVGVHLP